MKKHLKLFAGKIGYLLIRIIIYGQKIDLENRKEALFQLIRTKGRGCHFHGNNWEIRNPEYLVLGNNVHIGDNAFFMCDGGLLIGDNAHVSRNVSIYARNHNYLGIRLPYDEKQILKSVVIERNVWIGMGVSIVPGVKIGEGAIIGMGATVTENVEAFCIIRSPSNKKIKLRDQDHYNRLVEKGSFGGINGSKISTDDFYPTLAKTPNLLFILSTGRSGSTSIAKSLNLHSKIECRHETFYSLIHLSSLLAYKKVSEKIVEEMIKNLFDIGTLSKNNINTYGESDQRLWNMVPILIKLFPNAKFIHLVRNGKSTVNSTFARGWYSEKDNLNPMPWAQYRLSGYECGVISEHVWNNWSAFEKNCWYWKYVNESIAKSFQQIPNEQKITISLEQFNKDNKIIQKFLNVEEENIVSLKSNVVKTKDQAKLNSGWNNRQSQMFDEICGPFQSKYFS